MLITAGGAETAYYFANDLLTPVQAPENPMKGERYYYFTGQTVADLERQYAQNGTGGAVQEMCIRDSVQSPFIVKLAASSRFRCGYAWDNRGNISRLPLKIFSFPRRMNSVSSSSSSGDSRPASVQIGVKPRLAV